MELTYKQRVINFMLTAIQYIGFGFYIFNYQLISVPMWGKVMQLAAMLLAIWAIWEMKKSKINISTRPLANAVLVESGPYALIRHPMYSSLWLFFLPHFWMTNEVIQILFLAILLVNLFLKMKFEENLLRRYFDNYQSYAQKTKQLIPFIY